MKLRSGRRLASPPRRVRPRKDDGDGEEDRISGLPVELLLAVLRCLGCAGEAARTSVLSHRWRGLWTELRELRFTGVRLNALGTALSRLRPKLINRLDITVWLPVKFRGKMISSLLRAADRLQPAEFILSLDRYWSSDIPVPLELPSFGSTPSIHLLIPSTDFMVTLTPAGELASLEQLTLKLGTCHADLGALLSRCPRLRKLTLGLDIADNNTVAIESESMEELRFSIQTRTDAADVVIVAPQPRKFISEFNIDVEFTVSRSAPNLEDFHLRYNFDRPRVGFGDNKWALHSLTMESEWSDRDPAVRVHVLTLRIHPHKTSMTSEQSIAEEIARLPVKNFSVLRLHLTGGHVYGAFVLQLLQIRTSVRKLKLVLWAKVPSERRSPRCSQKCYNCKCSENCDCDQDGNWRNEQISLLHLEDVEIQGFSAADHEVDFLELLFRSAPMLKRINIQLSDEVSRNKGGQLRLHSIFEANASVKCSARDIPYYEEVSD